MATRSALRNNNPDQPNGFVQNGMGHMRNSEQELRHIKNSDTNLWNSFEDQPTDKNSGSSAESERKLQSIFRVIKFIAAIITFIVILGTTVLSKTTLLFMTSQLRKDVEVQYCDITQPEKDIVSIIPDSERIAWIWAIIFAYAFPEVITFLRSARICFFKSTIRPDRTDFLVMLIFNTFHIIGLAIFAILILPNLDVVQGAMLMNCICFVPAVLGALSRYGRQTKLASIGYVFDLLAIAGQLSGFVLWPIVMKKNELYLIPIALFLISFLWWENFVSTKGDSAFIKKMAKIKFKLKKSHYYNHLILAPWKILVFALSMILLSQYEFFDFFTKFEEGWGHHLISITETKPKLTDLGFPNITDIPVDLKSTTVGSSSLVIMWFLLINICSSYFSYTFSKFACKIQVQTFSFAFPVNLAVPVTVSALLLLCGLRTDSACYFHNGIPDYLFFNSPPVFSLVNYLSNEYVWIFIFWIASQLWVTRHIWSPNAKKNAASDHLFVHPQYNGLVIDQSLALNRRRDDLEIDIKNLGKEKDCNEYQHPIQISLPKNASKIEEMAHNYIIEDSYNPDDKVPKLKICATMWHEEEEEMVTFLKSIFRLDMDQCAHRMAKSIGNDQNVEGYYELETHIFFDDAFVNVDPDKWFEENGYEYPGNEPMNDYVKKLIKSVNDAAYDVYKTDMKIKPPVKYETPYGGRLQWTLPGQTYLFVHLKNKKKIKAKKRWSQVMYMYYLLGYQIMQDLDMNEDRKCDKSENTFLLALDGDIDFQPIAVHLLISRMKTYDNLGAACGRIHPTGGGPMVWYQKFEYAIGHWLQKATEHIIGCVLCSPGCFSLFRGSALMAKSVMKKYTAVSKEGRDFVQYDQGEDRWLCTLLLKQRFRVEYIAASDSYTHAPEGFNEFFNQRRRWIPSTMANILDLIMDAKVIVRSNDSISMPYIAYQFMLMVGTILGPGTIFLMLVGSLVAVFRINIWTSFLWNFIPLMIFMIVCYLCKQDTQLTIATLISAVYGLVMMAVLIGVVIQLNEDGILAPTSLFFFAIALQIIVTGLMHPQEILCLLCGIVYYVTIPSMYLLLVIYSIFNMNDNTWGTRENPKPEEQASKGPGKSNPSPTSTAQSKGYFDFLRPKTEETGAIDFSFAGLFRLMLFTQPKVDSNQASFIHLADQLKDIKNLLQANKIDNLKDARDRRISRPLILNNDQPRVSIATIPVLTPSSEFSNNDDLIVDMPPVQLPPPDWRDDPLLAKSTLATIPQQEDKFWEDLIETYLKPDDPEAAKKIAKERAEKLDRLRDLCVFAFLMINALFVVVILLLQLNRNIIFIKWPFGAKNFITFDEGSHEINITREYLELEPIGMLFVIFFGIILFIQFVAMLMHRYGTFTQILSAVDLNCYCGNRSKEISPETDLNLNAVEFAKVLQLPEIADDDDDSDGEIDDQDAVAMRRNTIKKYLNKRESQDWSNLEKNFLRRLEDLGKTNTNENKKLLKRLPSMRRETINCFVDKNNIQEITRRLTVTNKPIPAVSKTAGNNGIPVSLMGNSQPFEARSSLGSDAETTTRFRPRRRSTTNQPISEPYDV